MESIRKLFRDLENEISSEKFIKLYQKVRDKYPPIKSYLTPQDLIQCLHNQNNPDYILNDKILSSLMLEYQIHPDSNLIGSYLIILFRPGLLKLFSQFRERAKQFPSIGNVDLWFQIVTLFFEELNQFGLNEDKTKVASKILGRIRNKLRDYFTGLFKEAHSEQEASIYPEVISTEPARIDSEEIILLLEGLVKSGVISETDKYILLATRVYGTSMKYLSTEYKDLSYEAIRQRKVRAEKAIRKYIKRLK